MEVINKIDFFLIEYFIGFVVVYGIKTLLYLKIILNDFENLQDFTQN